MSLPHEIKINIFALDQNPELDQKIRKELKPLLYFILSTGAFEN